MQRPTTRQIATGLLGLALVTLMLAGPILAADERWLHVRVEEQGRGGEKVNVNVPLSLIEAFLPLIDTPEFHGGRIHIDNAEFDSIDWMEILRAVRDAPDAEFVTVESESESVRVFKEQGFIRVMVDDRRGDERVRVQVPLRVIEALVSGEPGELNIAAALSVLGQEDFGDLVLVESDRETVRVWIDDRQEGR